ncbi:MAG: hypothetical protein ACXVQR_01665 [Solirubrobacteraceae bacterium]
MSPRTSDDGVQALIDALRAEGGTLAEVLTAAFVRGGDGGAAPGPAQVAASGPRARGRESEYELLVEMILEGSRLHYGRPRVVITEDPDLALLLGDQLYALGLARLAELGDLDAVGELADIISLVAQAHASADAALADAVWDAGAVAIGWGPGEPLRQAKLLVRAGRAGAAEAMLEAAGRAGKSDLADDLGA